MNRWTLGTTGLVLLVLLAGCVGLSPDGDGVPESTPDETLTGTPTDGTTATPTRPATPTPTTVVLPPGWSETGVNDTATVVQGHYAAVLNGAPVTVTYRSTVLESAENLTANTTLAAALDPSERRLVARIDASTSGREVFFANGTLTRWSPTNETVLGHSDAEFPRVVRSVDWKVLKSQLLLYELEVSGVVSRDGNAALRYDVVGVHENAVSRRFGAPESATGRVVVAETGRVLDIETTVTYTRGEVTYDYAQTDIGATSVDRPDWLVG